MAIVAAHNHGAILADNMWNNVSVDPAYGRSERNRRLAREAEHKRNFFLGLIFFPIWVAGWFPILWLISKVFK